MDSSDAKARTDGATERPKAWWWLVAVLVLFAPFWNKAFHVDDGAYLHLSTLYGWNPLEASPSDYVYLGIELGDLLPYESKHPFLVPWVMKLVRSTLGESEWAMHAVFTLFALGAFAGVLALARELFPRRDRATGLFFALFLPLPVFLVPAHSVMTDVPAMALLVWAVALWVRGVERRSRGALALAALAFFCGACTTFQSVLVLPAVAYFAWRRGRFDGAFFASVAAPCLAFLGYLFAVYFRHGVFPFVTENPESGFSMAEEVQRGLGSEGSAVQVLGSKAVHVLAIVGLTFVALLPLRAVLAGDLSGFARRAIAATLAALLVLHGFLGELGVRADYSLGQLTWLAVLVGLGGMVVVTGLRAGSGRDPADRARFGFLALWSATVLLFNIVVLPFSAARYELLALPPLFVAVWSRIAWEGRARRPRAVRFACAATLMLGLGAAWVDARQADAYRDLAAQLRREHPDARLWFYGEWGLRHYLQRAGGRYLLRDRDDTEVGDLVVIADMHQRFSWPPYGLSRRVEQVNEMEYGSALPVRLFGGGSMAGFWSHGWGFLPLTISRAPLESIQVWQVTREKDEQVEQGS